MSHEDLRSRLDQLEEKRKATQKSLLSLWNLVNSIHSAPVLREWVTMESRPLQPLVVRFSDPDVKGHSEATVHVLVSAQSGHSDSMVMLLPWAYIRWHWPSGRLLGILEVSGHFPEFETLPARDFVCTKEFADSVQEAMEKGNELPLPPEDLRCLYSKVLDNTPAPIFSQPKHMKSDNRSQILRTTEGPVNERGGNQLSSTERSSSAESAADMSIERFESFLSRSRTLVEELGIPEILTEWRRISSRLGLGPFSVAVVGEFSRGKSSLINDLLDQELLPVGDTPTTATLTKIRYGSQPKLVYVGTDGHREQLELAPESWEKFSGYENDSTFEGFLLIDLPNDWLRECDINFVDTPGAGDLSGKRAALVTQTIASCDAALLAVSATMAMSLTERGFLEEHVLSKGTPRVAVVITRLDQVPEDQRKKVIEYVRNKLQEWAPEAIVCSAKDFSSLKDSDLVSAAGSEQIRNMVTSWAQDGGRVALVARQLACQLLDLLANVRGVLEVRERGFEASQEEKGRLVRHARESLDRQSLIWEDMRLKLDSRELLLEQWLQKMMLGFKDNMISSLRFQLNHTNNPGEWWDNDLPFLLRRELQVAARNLEPGLNERIQQDSQWLIREVRQSLHWDFVSQPEQPVTLTSEDSELHGQSGIGSDLSQHRNYARVGTAIVTAGAMLAFGPLALIGGVLAAIATEKYMSGKIDDQKGQLAAKIAEVVEKTLEGLVDDLKKSSRVRYKNLLSETLSQETAWARTRLKALEEEIPESAEDELPKIRKMISYTHSLSSDLKYWIEGGERE